MKEKEYLQMQINRLTEKVEMLEYRRGRPLVNVNPKNMVYFFCWLDLMFKAFCIYKFL